MSTSAITSSLLSLLAQSPSQANEFVTNLNKLAKDLQGGDLSAAQQDYVTLSEAALSGTGTSTATTSTSGITTSLLSNIASSSSSSSSFVTELNQLGTDLQNGDSAAAQQDLLGLDSTALNAATASSTASSTSSTIAVSNQVQSAALIQTIVQALGTGNDATASSALSQLASISTSAAGASALEQQSQLFASSAGSSSSSVSQLLDTLNTSSNSSGLSLLA